MQCAHPSLVIPTRALILQSSGLQIAVLDDQNRVTLQSVTVGRDFGKLVEIESGLTPGAHFVTNPSDLLRTGTQAQPAPTEAQKITAK